MNPLTESTDGRTVEIHRDVRLSYRVTSPAIGLDGWRSPSCELRVKGPAFVWPTQEIAWVSRGGKVAHRVLDGVCVHCLAMVGRDETRTPGRLRPVCAPWGRFLDGTRILVDP